VAMYLKHSRANYIFWDGKSSLVPEARSKDGSWHEQEDTLRPPEFAGVVLVSISWKVEWHTQVL